MKKFFALSIMCTALNSYADSLHSYDHIKEAVTNGKLVRIVIDYSKCTGPASHNRMANYHSAYTPNEIAINNDAGYIAASLMHFTVNNPQFPNQAVYEFNRYTVSSNGDVSLSLLTLNAADFTPLSSKRTYTCKMNESAKFYLE